MSHSQPSRRSSLHNFTNINMYIGCPCCDRSRLSKEHFNIVEFEFKTLWRLNLIRSGVLTPRLCPWKLPHGERFWFLDPTRLDDPVWTTGSYPTVRWGIVATGRPHRLRAPQGLSADTPVERCPWSARQFGGGLHLHTGAEAACLNTEYLHVSWLFHT